MVLHFSFILQCNFQIVSHIWYVLSGVSCVELVLLHGKYSFLVDIPVLKHTCIWIYSHCVKHLFRIYVRPLSGASANLLLASLVVVFIFISFVFRFHLNRELSQSHKCVISCVFSGVSHTTNTTLIAVVINMCVPYLVLINIHYLKMDYLISYWQLKRKIRF